jgi:hypothetical protein
MIAGLLVAIVCALAAVALVQAVGRSDPALALARPVPMGTQITADDLAVVQVPSQSGLNPVPADDKDKVVGRYAAMPLAAGTLLTPDQVTDNPMPGPGKQLVSLSLKAEKMPARALQPGDKLALVVIPDDRVATGGDGGAQPLAPPATFGGQVVKVGEPTATGDVVIDVAVAKADGPTVAALAAQSRIALVVTAE